jgi:hypothetical protein
MKRRRLPKVENVRVIEPLSYINQTKKKFSKII